MTVYDCNSNNVVLIPQTGIYFENGTCKCPAAAIGDTEVIGGITYTAVDNTTIRTEIAANNPNLCTSQVTNMSRLFNNNTTFNSDISFWDTSNVTNMSHLIDGALVFDQNIGNWDISNVTRLISAFRRTPVFNQDISNWDTSNVRSMNAMFENANSFNQNLSGWNILNVVICANFSSNTSAWSLPKPNFTNCTP